MQRGEGQASRGWVVAPEWGPLRAESGTKVLGPNSTGLWKFLAKGGTREAHVLCFQARCSVFVSLLLRKGRPSFRVWAAWRGWTSLREQGTRSQSQASLVASQAAEYLQAGAGARGKGLETAASAHSLIYSLNKH